MAGEMSEGLEKSRLTVIARMIVGHTERIESPAQNGQHARVGAEAENLVVERFPGRGNRAFEVADAVVGVLQQRRERCERIPTAVDQAARTIVEHDVADENQTDGFGARASGEYCPRYAEQDDQQAQAASPTHRAGPLLEDHSHQYCSSPSRIGS